jgi:hypothetical protein
LTRCSDIGSAVRGDSLHIGTLRKAIAIAGGADELALHVGVAVPIVAAWLDGRIAMPTSYFLKLVDIVMNDKFAERSMPQATGEEPRLR